MFPVFFLGGGICFSARFHCYFQHFGAGSFLFQLYLQHFGVRTSHFPLYLQHFLLLKFFMLQGFFNQGSFRFRGGLRLF